MIQLQTRGIAMQPVGLGYQGSENLYRTQEGIKWKPNKGESPFQGMFDYPVLVEFTKAGLQLVGKKSEEYRESNIRIIGKTPAGKRIDFFTIDSLFFSHKLEKSRFWRVDSCYVRQSYSPLHPEHEQQKAELNFPDSFFRERINNDTGISPDETISSFLAVYELKYTSELGVTSVEESSGFQVKQTRKDESLFLEIDADTHGNFILHLDQPNPELLNIAPPPPAVELESKEPSQEKLLDEGVPEEFICPIRFSIMLDPVVDLDGVSYSREGIMKWLENNDTSPVTQQPLKLSDLKPNRALKNLIEKFKKNKP
jgi:hypothetical protein